MLVAHAFGSLTRACQVGEYNYHSSQPLAMYRKRPVVWLDGELDVPKLASVELKYKKIKVLIALVCSISYYTLFIYLFETRNISDGNQGFGASCAIIKVT